MAVTRGPLFSFDASGKLGGALVFSKWKGRPYVRSLVTPSNPRSGAQTGFRAMMAFLSREWAGLGPTEKASWGELAEQAQISPFNAYVRANMNQWKQTQAPSQAYPKLNNGTAATFTGAGASGGVGEINVAITTSSADDGWGLVIMIGDESDYALAIARTRSVINIEAETEHSARLGNVAPGTYRVRGATFTVEGSLETTFTIQASVTVT